MKTNFKKTLAVLLAVLMLTSIFNVAVFAADDTYTVTYRPGAGVEGEEIVETISSKKTVKIKGALYERPGFTQTGWSTTEGGTITNTFNSTYRKKTDIILYPVWKGESLTLTYAPGAFGTGTGSTVNVEAGQVVGLPGVMFTRDGYVQDGWSLTDGGDKKYDLNGNSDPISGNTTLYPHWLQRFNIVFAPGAYGVGTQISEFYDSGAEFSTKGAIFTREGYLQTGWATEDGGRKVYELEQNFIAVVGDLTLYPVWTEVVYGLEVDTEQIFFGNVCEDYEITNIETVTITNTSTVPVKLVLSPVDGFEMSYSEPVVIQPASSYNVQFAPKAGLGFGDYEETLTITIDGVASVVETVALKFYVSEHVFGTYKSDNNASYTADGTKTAECVKGCGTKDEIADPGSMKVYSADNNDAAGLASSYVHHRTVRFTAYGSGMDATAEDNLTKRFRPVSWYVDEEFNGEFTGNKFENGYDVTFTHTIFGKYTLVINYVEEEFDATTGEWVATDVTDTKTFEYTVGTTAEEEQEIVRPNTILNILFGLFAELLKLLGIGG